MASDEHGMPVPDQSSPLPWERFDSYGIVDANGDEVVCVVRKAFIATADCKFAVHAANNIIECRDIVRRLAEPGAVEIRVVVEQIAADAARLWAKMKAESEGQK